MNLAKGVGEDGAANEEVSNNYFEQPLSASVTPIPDVVQRALSTGYTAQSSACNNNDDTILGLEGFSLPQYLSLRYKLSSRLDDGLRFAQDEEWRDRQKRQNIISATQKKKKSKRKRKRKPKANVPTNYEDASSEPKGKRRRKKRSKGTKDSDDKNNNEMNHYRMMTRIIIAPYTLKLIAAMNRCKENSEDLNDGDTTKDVTHPPYAESASTSKKITNVYAKKARVKSTQVNSLALLPPQESLECIVDGVICALVRRTHKFRRVPASQKTIGKINHRRRKRRTKMPQKEQCPASEEATQLEE